MGSRSTVDPEDPDDLYEWEDRPYLEDDEYDAFIQGEFDGSGALRGAPSIPLLIGLLVVILLVVALLMAR